jgi:hypothetical protein
MSEILERLNEASYTAWPFVEDSDRTSHYSGGTRVLPDSAVLDCRAVVYGYVRGRLSLDRVRVTPGQALFYFKYEVTDPAPETVELPVLAPTGGAWTNIDFYEGSVHYVSVSDVRFSLYVTFGKGVRLFCEGALVETYTLFGRPEVEPSCIRPADKHFVRSCTAVAGTKLTGDVKLQEGYNIEAVLTKSSNTLRLSAELGAGEGVPCEPLLPPGPSGCEELVYRINGAGPDWRGAFKFMAGGGFEIISHPDLHKVTLKTPYLACSPGCADEGPETWDESCVTAWVPHCKGGSITISGDGSGDKAEVCVPVGTLVTVEAHWDALWTVDWMEVDGVSIGPVGAVSLTATKRHHDIRAYFKKAVI